MGANASVDRQTRRHCYVGIKYGPSMGLYSEGLDSHNYVVRVMQNKTCEIGLFEHHTTSQMAIGQLNYFLLHYIFAK